MHSTKKGVTITAVLSVEGQKLFTPKSLLIVRFSMVSIVPKKISSNPSLLGNAKQVQDSKKISFLEAIKLDEADCKYKKPNKPIVLVLIIAVVMLLIFFLYKIIINYAYIDKKVNPINPLPRPLSSVHVPAPINPAASNPSSNTQPAKLADNADLANQNIISRNTSTTEHITDKTTPSKQNSEPANNSLNRNAGINSSMISNNYMPIIIFSLHQQISWNYLT